MCYHGEAVIDILIILQACTATMCPLSIFYTPVPDPYGIPFVESSIISSAVLCNSESLKPCIVIVLDILSKLTLLSNALDTAVSGVGSSPALATCETRQVLLAGVSGGFPGVLPFRPPIDWLVSMSEIILKGTLN